MYPAYVHAILPDVPEEEWRVQRQGVNECGCTAPANALNLLRHGSRIYDKDQFVREAGLLFQRKLGGTPSFVTETLLRRHGAGTHFGNLSQTNGEAVLRDLIRRGVPVAIELGQTMIGPFKLYGQHSVLLVGYSDRYVDQQGVAREEYYLLDAQHIVDGQFGMQTNNVDRDGDGAPESYPGNRTLERDEFWRQYPTGIYFPVFPSQAEHDAWYAGHIRAESGHSIVNRLRDRYMTGSYDFWIG